MASNDNNTTEKEEPTYSRDRLITEATDFFGEPSHVVAGALANVDPRRQNFSRSEVEKAIKDWLRKPVDG